MKYVLPQWAKNRIIKSILDAHLFTLFLIERKMALKKKMYKIVEKAANVHFELYIIVFVFLWAKRIRNCLLLIFANPQIVIIFVCICMKTIK